MYDFIIIGGGPAGVAAGVYTARKKLRTLVIAESFGGQSITSDTIENWIGTVSLSGFELAKNLENHLRAQEAVEIRMPARVRTVRGIPCPDGARACDFEVETETGDVFRSKAVLVASGSRRRRLGVPGEDVFEGKGVAFCSTCDAPIFAGKRVAVVGGGNSGLEAAVDLLPYASHITILHRGASLRGDAVTQEKIRGDAKIAVLLNTAVEEIFGEHFVKGIRYRDLSSGEAQELPVEGVFVEIGSVPNSEIVAGLAERNSFGEVIVNPRTGETSQLGVFAAGDVTDELYKQNNISVGDGIKAALSAYNYILGLEKHTVAEEVPNGSNGK